jgi:hypothetical protein
MKVLFFLIICINYQENAEINPAIAVELKEITGVKEGSK